MRGIAKALALALLTALLIYGCGGSSGSSQNQQSTGQSQPSSQGEEHKGGEASIEGFGSEAEGAERRAILSAFGGYLGALAAEDPAAACSHLASQLRQGLQQLTAKAPAGQGCAQILPKLLSPDAPEIARAQAQGEIAKVRVEGERAFVVFHAPGAKLFYLPLAREGGGWKAAAASGAVLVPEL